MFRTRNFVVSALLAAAVATGLFAQNNLNQQITGDVTDATGAAMPNAMVTVVDLGTGLTRKTSTNAAGNYTFPDLPTGKYRVTCDAPGFKQQVIDNNTLSTNVSIEVNCKLQVGSQAESVTVQADVAVVETTNGDLGFTVTGEQASELQLNGRNFPELLQLLPGVSTNYTDGFGLFGGYGVNNSGQSINGGRTDTTTWNLDGGDNKDNGGGGNNFVNVNPDAIGEFRVLTSNFSAESGTSSGAVVNIAIRSGTKDFHGRLYEYWRNDHLAAYSYGSIAKTKLRWNNFGGNIGGPVIIPGMRFNRDHDKLFFFYSEDLKYLRTGATTSWTVPLASQRTGDFRATPNSAAVNIKDPVTGVPYANNILPQSVINPDMQKLLNVYPNANVGANTYTFNKTTPTNVHQEVFKSDYNQNEKNQWSFHYVHDYYSQLENTTNLIEYYRQIPGLNVSLQWNHVFTPTLINVAQFTYSGNVIIEQGDVIPNDTFIHDYTRKGFGISMPTLYNASPDIPQVAVSGFTTLSVSPLSFNNFNRIFDWKDNLTKIIGNHSFKTGILVMRSRKNQDNPPAINGQLTFNSGSRTPNSGNSLSDALLGAFQQYQEYSGVRQGWYRFTQVEPYVQDDWKVNRRLTVNIGMRWSYMQPQYSALNNTVQFLPQFFDPSKAAVINPSNGVVTSAPSPYNGLVLTGSGFPDTAKGRVQQYDDPAVKALFHDLPKGGAYSDWGGFAPRLGFAYDLTGNQSTVLRGGFGLAYERIEGNFIFSGINNAPFNPVATILNGYVTDPGNGATGAASVQTINNSHYLDMKLPRVATWSLGVQRKLARNTMLTVTYVGSGAWNLAYIDDINQPDLGVRNRTFVPGTTTLANPNYIRPYLGYGTIQEYTTGANYHYNSLQSQFRKEFRGGRFNAGSLNVAFTWESAMTDANAYNTTSMDAYNLRRDYGPSSNNRKVILVPSWVYPIPFWLGGGSWYKQALGGWQVNGVAQIQSGLPVNPTISPDTAGIINGNQRPNLVGDPYANLSGNLKINPYAFALPATSTYGNMQAYTIHLPAWVNVNSSLVKSFYSGSEAHRLKWDVRFEMYNVANHLVTSAVNTGSINFNAAGQQTTANWGIKSGAIPPRIMQASLRLNF
jgi:hypothetical protein